MKRTRDDLYIDNTRARALTYTFQDSQVKMVNNPLQVKPLHETFAAEVSGVDFSQPISPELYMEIRAVVDRVC